MSILDLNDVPEHKVSNYPVPFNLDLGERVRQRLGEAGGLTQFGVNLIRLYPGAWSGQRHWHSLEDEFVYVISGELVLITDNGEQVMRAGGCAAFPANAPNGHHIINKSKSMAVCFEVGSRHANDCVVYSDIDMVFDPRIDGYAHKDGTPYSPKSDRSRTLLVSA